MTSREAAAELRRGLFFIDEAFERARAVDGTCVPCRRGCSRCCAAVFDVHEADALLLGDWLASLSGEERAELHRRSALVVRRVEEAAAGLARDGETALEGWSAELGFKGLPAPVVTRLAAAVTEACPLLGAEGECRAHASRPAICRLGGLPWKDTASGALLPDFCRLEPAMARNPPQELDLGRLDGLRLEVDEAIRAGGRRPRRSFVAEIVRRLTVPDEGA